MDYSDWEWQSDDYERIARAIRYIEKTFRQRPNLDQIAAQVHLSRFHFTRLFKRWAGISPMQFLGFLTLEYTKDLLARSRSLLDTALDAGLSGTARLPDLFVTYEAMTPGEYKQMGTGLSIDFGCSPTPFGECFVATTQRGICQMGFVPDGQPELSLEKVRRNWPRASLREDADAAKRIVRRIFGADRHQASRPFHLLLKGTNFQVHVWRALLTIPRGRVVAYQDIAAFIGRPTAVRAVAHAVAINPVAYLIPCHRVIAKNGEIHRYRWGTARKRAMIAWEAAAAGSAPSNQA